MYLLPLRKGGRSQRQPVEGVVPTISKWRMQVQTSICWPRSNPHFNHQHQLSTHLSERIRYGLHSLPRRSNLPSDQRRHPIEQLPHSEKSAQQSQITTSKIPKWNARKCFRGLPIHKWVLHGICSCTPTTCNTLLCIFSLNSRCNCRISTGTVNWSTYWTNACQMCWGVTLLTSVRSSSSAQLSWLFRDFSWTLNLVFWSTFFWKTIPTARSFGQ